MKVLQTEIVPFVQICKHLVVHTLLIPEAQHNMSFPRDYSLCVIIFFYLFIDALSLRYKLGTARPKQKIMNLWKTIIKLYCYICKTNNNVAPIQLIFSLSVLTLQLIYFVITNIYFILKSNTCLMQKHTSKPLQGLL